MHLSAAINCPEAIQQVPAPEQNPFLRRLYSMSELQEKIERIDEQGISKTGIYIREKILNNIGVPLDRRADVVVITGCNALLRPLILVQLADILTKLKVNFTFLSFEHCCFA